jgi:hypothetical protein
MHSFEALGVEVVRAYRFDQLSPPHEPLPGPPLLRPQVWCIGMTACWRPASGPSRDSAPD